MKDMIVYGISLLLMVILVSDCYAQDFEPSELVNGQMYEQSLDEQYTFKEANEESFQIDIKSGMLLPAEVENQSTDVQLSKFDFSLCVPLVSFEYGLRHYEWDNAKNLISSGTKLFEDLHFLNLNFEYGDIFYKDRLGYFIGTSLASGFEEEMSDSFQYGFYGGVTYKLSQNWEVSLGMVYGWTEVDDGVMPLVGFSYTSDSVLEYGIGFSASLGFPDNVISYAFSDKFLTNLYLGGDGNVYRLANDSSFEKKGYVETQDILVGWDINYFFTKNLVASFGVEYNFKREYTIYNSNGNKNYKHDIDDSLGIMASFKYCF